MNVMAAAAGTVLEAAFNQLPLLCCSSLASSPCPLQLVNFPVSFLLFATAPTYIHVCQVSPPPLPTYAGGMGCPYNPEDAVRAVTPPPHSNQRCRPSLLCYSCPQVFMGYFNNPEDAARAYDKKLIELHGITGGAAAARAWCLFGWRVCAAACACTLSLCGTLHLKHPCNSTPDKLAARLKAAPPPPPNHTRTLSPLPHPPHDIH